MFYEYDITIPANTTQANPYEFRVRLQRGIITEGSIQFPGGCAGLVNVAVYVGGFKLWPRNETGSIKGDNSIIPIREFHELKSGWNTIRVLAWNTDDQNSHTVTVRLTVLPVEIANPYSMFQDIRNALILLLRRIGVGQ